MMDPRMDSGMKTSDWPDKPFDPLMALLPEEVCWILDRAMACEAFIPVA
jgi:N-alpha-acetyltransferase 35, NatC auxiliary subunit